MDRDRQAIDSKQSSSSKKHLALHRGRRVIGKPSSVCHNAGTQRPTRHRVGDPRGKSRRESTSRYCGQLPAAPRLSAARPVCGIPGQFYHLVGGRGGAHRRARSGRPRIPRVDPARWPPGCLAGSVLGGPDAPGAPRMIWLLVIIGGAAGACCRYLIDAEFRRRRGSDCTDGILLVNGCGSFLLGTLSTSPPAMQALLGLGFCGALTTFSTVTVQVVQELAKDPRAAGRHLVGNFALSLVAAAAGIVLRNWI